MNVLTLRNKMLMLGGVPSLALVAVCALAANRGDLVVAVTALLGLLLSLALLVVLSGSVVRRVDGLIRRAAFLADRADAVTTGWGATADRLRALGRLLDAIELRIGALAEPSRNDDEYSTGEIVSALAERSRALMDQQLAHIDWLEATEQDPERLEQLFELDHLAYRLRRSTESMVVAGGGEPTTYTGGPTPITDILRVASGAVEAYRAVKLVAVDDVLIAGQPGYELAQLMAELIDNATRFSADDQTVEVRADCLDNGDHRITVIDRGVGMDTLLLETTNRVLAEPPDLDAGVGDAIGLVVVGRLAARIGAAVELVSTPGHGVTAQVVVPSTAIVADVPGHPAGTSEARSAKRERRRRGVRRRSSGPDRSTTPEHQPLPSTPSTPSTDSVPASVARLLGLGPNRSQSLDEAVPTGPAFEAGVDALLDGGGSGGSREPHAVGASIDQRATATPNRAADVHTGGAGATVAPPATPGARGEWMPPAPAPAAGPADLGLVRRTRGANRGPITAGRRSHVSNRPPEEVRSMITRYRDGLRGRGDPDDPGGDDPGSDDPGSDGYRGAGPHDGEGPGVR